MSGTDVDFTDPSLAYGTISWQLEYATALKLFNYPDAPAPEGSMIVPEAAAGMPVVSADGKTYTITVKPGFQFSDGRPVTALNFAFAINRALSPVMQSPGEAFITDIVGAQAVIDGKAQTASGVRVDGDKLIIELTQPDGGLPVKLAMPFFQAIPLDLPLDRQGVSVYASAGPYFFAGRDVGRQITIKRNPYYAGSRPAFADEFDITVNTNLDQSLLQVTSGAVDYDLGGLPPTAIDGLGATYGVNVPNGRFHVSPLVEADYIALNTSRPPFSNVNLRKAFNYAIDRPALIARRGAYAATATDQILPPGMGGFRDVHLYPLDGPDLVAARALAGASCGTVKLWTTTSVVGQNLAQVAKHDLEEIGCNVETTSFQNVLQMDIAVGTRGADFDAVFTSWSQHYPDPYDFLDVLLNGEHIQATNNNNFAYFNDAAINAKLDQANLLVGADRYRAYGDLDIEIMRDHAPWVPYDNRSDRDFIADRIVGYLFQPANASADLNTFRLRALNDTTPPTLTLPSPIWARPTGPAGATVAYTVTATDDVDPQPTVSCAPPSGSTFGIGFTRVACTATDSSGNQATGSFTVEVSESPSPRPAGGPTLRFNMSATDVDFTDPSLAYGTISWQLEYATALKLYNYPDAPAPEGSRLQPEAAAGFPVISPDGKTYTITVKPGFWFSDGRPVRADNFAFAINRALSPVLHSPAASFIQNIVGAQAVIDGRAQTASGVRVDGDKLIIELTQPDGGIVSKLGMPFFQALPLDLPLDANGVNTYPSAGPYSFAGREIGRQITIKRNPYYTGSRPAYANEFDITVNTNLDQSLLQVKAGVVDYDLGGLPATAHADLGFLYGVNAPGGRYHVNPLVEADYIALNTSRPPFSNVNLRKAFNYAVDRPAMIALRGAYAATPTDQILPPGMGGFRDADLYPLNGPDLATARSLAGDSCGTVKLWSTTSVTGQTLAEVAKHSLEHMGCTVEVTLFQGYQLYTAAGQKGADFDAALVGWNQDYPDPYDFLDTLLNGEKIHNSNNNNLAYFDNPAINVKLDQANLLVGAERYQAYGDLDVEIMRDHAPWVPYDNRNEREFTAARIAGYLFQPANATADLNTFYVRTSSDATPPALSLPGRMSVEATGPAGAAVTYKATASDDVDPNPVLTCTPPSGSVFPIGATTVTCTATDAARNTATGSFTVVVVDTTPPSLTLPPAMSVEATGPAGAAVTYRAIASDAVDPSPVLTCTPPSGSMFALGVTTVACAATDAAGNRSSGSFTVETSDTTPPSLVLPGSMSMKATGLAGARAAYAVTATDAVDPSPVVSCAPPPGSVFAIGSTRVACAATDSAGNRGTGSFAVEVVGGAKAHHVMIEFTSELSGLLTRWEGDVSGGAVMAMADGGALEWVAADARYGNPAVSLSLDFRSRHIGRLMTGSLSATRDTVRIQARDVVAPFALGLDGAVTTPVPIRATYNDGVHLAFGWMTLRFADNG